jgi:predicted nucleotidyltransferase
MSFDRARDLVKQRLLPRHTGVQAAIIGGSIARGEATATSDIDLFLLFDEVPHAWRETLVIDGQTVELYGHDVQSFEYFCRKVDRPGGRIPMAMMVLEGRNILDPTPAYGRLCELARAIHAEGPPVLAGDTLNSRRYEITTLLEDLVDSTVPDETVAVATKLYDLLANFVLRAGGAWTGMGKHLARRLRQFDPAIASELHEAMRRIVVDDAAGKQAFTRLVHRVLEPHGGALLAGYRLEAPAGWKMALADAPGGA